MISVDPSTFVITVPQADLSFVSGTLYNHDTDAFRLELKSFEDSEQGIVMPKTHNHNTEVTIAGTTYARAIEMLAPYSVEYENGSYSVVLQGSNNNIWDIEGGILAQNTVQVIPTNAAGLVSVGGGGGEVVVTNIPLVNWTGVDEDGPFKLMFGHIYDDGGPDLCSYTKLSPINLTISAGTVEWITASSFKLTDVNTGPLLPGVTDPDVAYDYVVADNVLTVSTGSVVWEAAAIV